MAPGTLNGGPVECLELEGCEVLVLLVPSRLSVQFRPGSNVDRAPLDAFDELDLEAALLCDTGGVDSADPAYPGGECLVGPGGGGPGGGGPGGGGAPAPGPGDPTE